jgi:hypothetical protein
MTVVFVMEWTPEEEGRREFRADLLDERDRKVLTIEGHTDVTAHGGVPGPDPLIMPLERVIFPGAGDYRFVLVVEAPTTPAFSVRRPGGHRPASDVGQGP